MTSIHAYHETSKNITLRKYVRPDRTYQLTNDESSANSFGYRDFLHLAPGYIVMPLARQLSYRKFGEPWDGVNMHRTLLLKTRPNNNNDNESSNQFSKLKPWVRLLLQICAKQICWCRSQGSAPCLYDYKPWLSETIYHVRQNRDWQWFAVLSYLVRGRTVLMLLAS